MYNLFAIYAAKRFIIVKFSLQNIQMCYVGGIRLKKLISLSVIFVIFAAALTFDGFAATAGVPYKNASSWAVPELDKAAGYGFITDKIRDKMNASITREEFAEIAIKLYEKCTGRQALYYDMSAFADTRNPEIFKAYNLKIVKGTDIYNRLFSPDWFTNREQIAAIMFRTVAAMNHDTSPATGEADKFTDEKDVSYWALEPVRFMIKNGFLKGADGKLNPKGTCTREAAVIIAARVYEKYSSNSRDITESSGINNKGSNKAYDWTQIVINDTEIFRDNYHIKEKDGFYYIFIDAERFKYAFKCPHAGSYSYPEVEIIGGSFSASWSNGEGNVLKVDLQEGNTEAIVDGRKVDAGMAPYFLGVKLYIPINLFISEMRMDVEMSGNNETLYIQYKNYFPSDTLVGTWSDTDNDLFSSFKDITSGTVPLPSYATAYMFNSDGTYRLRMVSAGGVNDTFIMQKGRYKIMGNTIMYYDTIETVYKGTPFSLKYEDKLTDRTYYDFIYNYDPRKDRIEIGGFWLNKVR